MLQSSIAAPANRPAGYRKTYQDVVDALDELPPEALSTVRDFVTFLNLQYRPKPTASDIEKTALFKQATASPLIHSSATIDVPIVQVQQLIGLLSDLEGDALADTEALYD